MAASATAPGLEASLSSLNSVDNDASAASSTNVDTQQSKWTSANTSLTPSPLDSREASPTRPTVKAARHTRTSTGGASRSRKNSVQDPSPPRLRSSVSNAPTRSSISSASTPALPPPSSGGPTIRAPIPRKPSLVSETSKDSPRWPVSPRLKSPPPILKSPAQNIPSSRNNEVEPPPVTAQHATFSPNPDPLPSDTESEDALTPSGVRTPQRGPSNGASTLETVQEVSQPNSPGHGVSLNSALDVLARSTEVLEASAAQQNSWTDEPNSLQSSQNMESGSDSGSQRAEKRRSVSAAPPQLHSQQSSSALKLGTKGQPGEGSGHMTVEEEKVTGLPQMTLKPIERGAQGSNGSLRAKPSTETIRPKKEKKKNVRKLAPAATGTVSSKADIFEAKVASAVEENDSSDSDETFVYDSNPPDVSDRPRRYHSRTPSATSMVSQADRNGLRSLHGLMDSHTATSGPKKNKFVNTFNGLGTENPPLIEDDNWSARGNNAGSARGSSRHHHHVGRWLRNSGNHTSLFDNDSPFPGTTRTRFSTSVPRHASNPPSPRLPNSNNTPGENKNSDGGSNGAANSNSTLIANGTNSTAGRQWASQPKRIPRVASIYNMDDTPGADDEHTPLLLSGTVRSARSRGNRRGHGGARNIESQTYRQRPSFLNRFASCLVLTIMLLLVITGAIGFMFATSQPLMELEIIKIENVLASEQELMMDIQVRAHNPNVVVVMVDSADLEVFAKSPHAGKDSEWWRDPSGVQMAGGKVKPPTEPPLDDTDPNMRLGNIHHFDSPLTFEGSFFRTGISTSSGELRLARPGNSTERGSERWERILEHNFTLILQGTLKYQLPLSSKQRSVIVSGSARVLPNSADQPTPLPNSTSTGLFRQSLRLA